MLIRAIDQRRYYNHLHTYDRPLNGDDPDDWKLIDDIFHNDLNQPIILFNAREESQLWLVSGHRRLQAYTWGQRNPTTIPAIICDDFDTLYKALLNEVKGADRTFVKPLTWRNRLEFGQILRGVQVFLRAYRRHQSGDVEGCTVSANDLHPVLDCRGWEWRHLRSFAAAIVQYETRKGVIHDSRLANKLLDMIDDGTMTLGLAREQYLARPNRVAPEVPIMSAAAWRERVDSLLRALELTSEQFEAMMLSANADIGAEEFKALTERIVLVRRTAKRTELESIRKTTERQVSP